MCFTKKATTQSDIQGSERFSLSNPGHVIREPSHNGLGAAILQGPWTLHASKQSSHCSLAADNTHGDRLGATQGGHGSPNMGDDSTGTVLSYQLEDAVYQSNTMYHMALMSQLFHSLAESHGQASMEVEEEVSHTATLHRPQVQIRQWALQCRTGTCMAIQYGNQDTPGSSGIPMLSRETSHIDKSKPVVMLTPPFKLGGTIP